MGVDQLIERLEQWDKWPAAWDPEAPGEIIAGKVLEYAQGDSPYGPCHVVILDMQRRQLGGRKAAHPARLAVWLSKEVLVREFKQQRPQLGELIAIKYVGPPDQETAYHQYKLLVDRAGQTELQPLGGEEPELRENFPQVGQRGVTARKDGQSGHTPVRTATRQRVDDELGVSRADLPSQRPLAGVSR